MKFRFLRARWIVTGVSALAAGVCMAQQGFPLKPGEWKVTTKAEGTPEPIELLFCLNNETWMKALTQNPVCKIQELNVSSKGIHYMLDCSMKTMQMKGPVDLTFDGMEHMTGKATLETVSGGKTTTSTTTTDYRWQGAACTAKDVNMRAKGAGK